MVVPPIKFLASTSGAFNLGLRTHPEPMAGADLARIMEPGDLGAERGRPEADALGRHVERRYMV